MTEGLEAISGEYYGRIIIIGRAESGENVVAYSLTGRSPPSRARILYEKKDGVIKTFPTNLKTQIDPEVKLSDAAKEEIRNANGNPALLIYDAIATAGRSNEFVVVSNGAQTNVIVNNLNGWNASGPLSVLASSLQTPHVIEGVDVTSFEPDIPNYTSRISGILTKETGILAIVRHEGNKLASKAFFESSLSAGYGRAISTYSGRNVPKGEVIPSYRGEPLAVQLIGKTPMEIAKQIYETLGPKNAGLGIISPGDDFRVGVAVAFYDPTNNKGISHSILNRSDIKIK